MFMTMILETLVESSCLLLDRLNHSSPMMMEAKHYSEKPENM
jgi:hypothetical protein